MEHAPEVKVHRWYQRSDVGNEWLQPSRRHGEGRSAAAARVRRKVKDLKVAKALDARPVERQLAGVLVEVCHTRGARAATHSDVEHVRLLERRQRATEQQPQRRNGARPSLLPLALVGRRAIDTNLEISTSYIQTARARRVRVREPEGSSGGGVRQRVASAEGAERQHR